MVSLAAFVPRHSGNVWSRYLTIESIVERGTFALDGSSLLASSGTPDLIMVRGQKFSDKPPVLSALGAVVYSPLAWCGLRMSNSPWSFVWVNWTLVVTLIASSSAAALFAIRRMLDTVNLRPWLADILTILLGIGTLVGSYAVTFNNHSVAMGLISCATALVYLAACRDRLGWKISVAAGLMVSLAAVIDIPAGGAAFVGIMLWVATRSRGQTMVSFLLAAVGPVLLHGLLQWQSSGSPMPVESRPELFEYPGSYWLTERGRWHETVPRWQWALEFVFGPQGWITVTPALIVGLAGIVAALVGRNRELRSLACVTGAVVVSLVIYYTAFVRRTDFGGMSFGTRHLLPLVPLVWFFAAALLARLHSPYWGIAFGVLVLLGVLYASLGVQDPWKRIEQRGDALSTMLRPLALYPWTTYNR